MSHLVRLLPSDRTFTVEAGETVLAAALRAGITLPYSCRNGVCGTCKAKVKSGDSSVRVSLHMPSTLGAPHCSPIRRNAPMASSTFFIRC